MMSSAALWMYVCYLYARFPGLHDPNSKPVTYWPEIDATLSSLIAFVTGIVGIPLYWYSRRNMLRAKRANQSDWRTTTIETTT